MAYIRMVYEEEAQGLPKEEYEVDATVEGVHR